jgi:quercetin dioxygenase-like cupin family protein
MKVKQVRRRRRVVALAVAALVPVAAGAALATPGTGLTPVFGARGTSAEALLISEPRQATVYRWKRLKTNSGKFVIRRVGSRETVSRAIIGCALDRQCDFVFQTITFAPGGHTGWHSHPGVLLVAVEAGAVTRYEALSCTRSTYSAGQSFVERGPNHIIFVKNEGTAPAKVQIAYVVPAGTANAALRIDQPAPSGCNP